MRRACATLGSVWPFAEIDAPPGLVSVPLASLWDGGLDLPFEAAEVTIGVAPKRAPRAAYALMLCRRGAAGTIFRWIHSRSKWKKCATTPVHRGADTCTVLELNHVLLGNVTSEDALKKRAQSLLAVDLGTIGTARIAAMLLSVTSTLLLFLSIGAGLESRSPEAFLLFLVFAAGAGLAGARLRVTARSVSDRALSRMHAQFRFEDGLRRERTTLRAACLTRTVQAHNRRTEDLTVLGAFTILLGFVYFIAPPIAIAAVFAVIAAGLAMGSGTASADIDKALERAEMRVGYALAALRASSNTTLVPRPLRTARRHILRDRAQRFAKLRGKASVQGSVRMLRRDLAYATAFVLVVGTYLLWAMIGGSGTATARVDTGVAVASIIEMAPIVVLISLSRSSVKTAQAIPRILGGRRGGLDVVDD